MAFPTDHITDNTNYLHSLTEKQIPYGQANNKEEIY